MTFNYIYLVSNGSTNIYKNSLSSFKNDISTLNKKKIDAIAVSEVWVDDVFTSPYCPQRGDCPSIIVTKNDTDSMTSSDIEKLNPTEKIFIPNAHFKYNEIFESISKCSGFELYSRRRKRTMKNELWYQNIAEQRTYFGCYASSKTGQLYSDSKDYFCYMYKPLSEALRDGNGGEDTKPFKTMNILDHEFDVYKLNSRGCYFICKQDFSEDEESHFKNLSTNFTPYLFLHSPSIKSHYFNQKLKSILCSLTLEKDKTRIVGTRGVDTDKYTCFHKEITFPIFFKTISDDLSTLEINLLDMNLNQASLQPGRTTIVKLITREKENKLISSMSDINVTVTSQPQNFHTNNNPAEFANELSEPLSLFGSQWYVALVSCSVPTRYKLPLDESSRAITFKISINRSIQIRSVTIPDDVQTAGEIIEAMRSVILSTEAIFSIDEHTTGLKIKAKRPIQIFMRGTLAYFLGSSTPYKDVKIVRTHLTKDEELIMPFVPRFLEYYPNSLFLYCDFVDYTILAGKNLRLMKIMPAYYSNFEHGKTSSNVRNLEFKTLEFHPVNTTILSTLNFAIRTQTGQLVPFSGTNPTLLSLMFTQNPDNK